jgi:hypothetical protein
MDELMISLKLNNDTYIPFNPEEQEPITSCSWKELFDKNQNSFFPYYAVGVTETEILKNLELEKKYKLYDGVRLQKQMEDGIREGFELLDPQTKSPIQKIYYLLFKCFRWEVYNVSKCKVLEYVEDPMLSLNPSEYLLALSRYADEEGLHSEVSLMQYHIGKYKEAAMQNSESLVWLWCAAMRKNPMAMALFPNA